MNRFRKTCLLWGLGAVMLLGFVSGADAETRQKPNLGNLLVVGGRIQYRYQRADGIRFDFIRRQKPFSLTEALWIRDALDRLPYFFLERVMSSGVKRFYRDGPNAVPPQSFPATVGEVAAVAVPPAPWGFVAFGDSAFHDGSAGIYRVVVHQLGHCVQWNEGGWSTVFGTPFTWISWTGIGEPFGLKSYNGFVSEYGRTNHREDYAETCLYFWLDPEKLWDVNHSKYWYMREFVFGEESPTDARQQLPGIAHVDPVIYSVSPASAEAHSFAVIEGEYFMGPFDGGFNVVRVRGFRADHVPISRNRIWFFVPHVDEGPAPVTVTTQDGSSNPAAFYSEGPPWWEFW